MGYRPMAILKCDLCGNQETVQQASFTEVDTLRGARWVRMQESGTFRLGTKPLVLDICPKCWELLIVHKMMKNNKDKYE